MGDRGPEGQEGLLQHGESQHPPPCLRKGPLVGWELNSARWNAGEAVSGEGLTLSLRPGAAWLSSWQAQARAAACG